MRLFKRSTPKHVSQIIDDLIEIDEDEMDRYAEANKQEVFQWVKEQVAVAIEAGVSIDETCATILGVVLMKSFEPFIVTGPQRLDDEEFMKSLDQYCHGQGHKMLELFGLITTTYLDIQHQSVVE